MTPHAYSCAIASDRTSAGRTLHLHRTPAEFRDLVIKTAALMLAGQLLELEGPAARREALAQVPNEFRDLVEMHVRRVFGAASELRARAELGEAA